MGTQRGNRGAMVRVALVGILMWEINFNECHRKSDVLSKKAFRHFGYHSPKVVIKTCLSCFLIR
jgi:hypothetical protein